MGLLRSAATISSFTFLSRITGLIRDVLIARAFGAGPLTDAFWVAFRIPNLLRRLFAEGAFSQAFVPILGQVKKEGDREHVQLLIDRVALLLSLALMVVTLIGMLATPWIVTVIASGLRAAERQAEFTATVWMTRLMFPYIVCMSLVALASGVLNTWSRFAVPAFTPLLLNFSMIAASLWLAPHLSPPIYALAVGVIVGGVLQLAIQWVALKRLGFAPRFNLKLREAWQNPTVRRVLRQMLPAIVGVSVAQISLLINTNIATWLQPGSVTWLSFADRLMEFPTALLGVALGTILLPKLSAAYAKQAHDEYHHLLNWGLQLVLLLGLPCALALAFIADALVATLFNYGAFNAQDVLQTKTAVMAYAVGLLGLLAIKILAPAFYARQNIKTPVRVAIFVLILTQLCNLVLVPWLGHAGLALSIGIGATVNALTLLFLLSRQGIYQRGTGWLRFALRMLPALLALSLTLYSAQHWIDWLALATQPWLRVGYLAGVMLACALAYFIPLYIAGFRISDFTRPH